VDDALHAGTVLRQGLCIVLFVVELDGLADDLQRLIQDRRLHSSTQHTRSEMRGSSESTRKQRSMMQNQEVSHVRAAESSDTPAKQQQALTIAGVPG
jgi:hypothetical protein